MGRKRHGVRASPYDTTGQQIAYRYTVTNTGNTTLAGPVTVTDDKAAVACPLVPSGGLAPGGAIVCSATYSITQADLDHGSVTNIATAHSDGAASGQVQATVYAVQRPGLSLVKTSSQPTYNQPGQLITYTYVVQNTGNTTLGPVTMSDDKIPGLKCSNPSLAPGSSFTCTATYTIIQADIDSGSVTNHATAQAGSTASNVATVTITAIQNPSLSLVKAGYRNNVRVHRPADSLQLHRHEYRQHDTSRSRDRWRQQDPGRMSARRARTGSDPDLHSGLYDHGRRRRQRFGHQHRHGTGERNRFE